MVDVMRQYVETLDISAPELSPFAWQYLGELSAGNMTFLCMNYWAMNRMAFHARRDPDHPMSRGRRYVELPAKIVERAEAICRRNRLDPSRPVVVLHARSHGYHRLKVQSFRNVEVRNYVPAVRRLLDLGYQVVRIGERGMESLRGDVPGIVELPLLPHYDNTLDAYFLFMISCQSGPCSLARAMGKPNLVANAVYHHTMLPESDELFLFKRYRDVGGSPLCLEEILARGGHLFDKSSHFEAAGIELEDATADEILAATEEMLTRLENPTREDTPAQAAFRELMNRFAAAGPGSHPLATLMTDYIGYGLPEGRVSDAVCRLRPGYVSPARPARAA
jgi:putative glycosyltransferase (TIGR04372 family)